MCTVCIVCHRYTNTDNKVYSCMGADLQMHYKATSDSSMGLVLQLKRYDHCKDNLDTGAVDSPVHESNLANQISRESCAKGCTRQHGTSSRLKTIHRSKTEDRP